MNSSTSAVVKPTTAKNRTIDLLKVFSILYVMLSRFHEPKIFYYPSCSFHVELFFFISGYTFRLRQQTLLGRLKYIISRTIKLLPYYYCYQLFYTILPRIIASLTFQGDSISSVSQISSFNLYKFFIEPLVQGSRNHFFEDAWLIPHLWLVQCVFVLIYINPWCSRLLDILYLVLFLVLNVVVTYWSRFAFGARPIRLSHRLSYEPLQSNYTIYDVSRFLSIKIGFTLVLLFLGLFYRQHIETTNFGKKRLFTIYGLIIAYVIVNYFWAIYESTTFFFLNKVDFASTILPCHAPIIIIFLGVYIFACLSHAAQTIIDENSFIYRISEKTCTILCQYTLYFYIINCCIATFIFGMKSAWVKLDSYPKLALHPELTWPLYIGVGLVLPTLLSSFGDRAMSRWYTSTTDHLNTKYHLD